MGYLDFTDAGLRALTVERRRERLLAVWMQEDPAPGELERAYQQLHGVPYIHRTPTLRFPTPEQRLRWASRPAASAAVRPKGPRYAKPADRSHGLMPERIFQTYWRIQSGACYLCAKPFVADDWATQDHVIPRSLGGVDGGNLLLACSACNNLKADRAPKPCEMLYLNAANARFLSVFDEVAA